MTLHNLDYIGSDFVELSFYYDDADNNYIDDIHDETIKAVIELLKNLDKIKKTYKI